MCFVKSVQLDLLLLEIPAILLIHKHQVEEIFDAELIVHCLVRGCQIIWREKQPAVETTVRASALIKLSAVEHISFM